MKELKTLKDLKTFYPIKTETMTDMTIVGNVTKEYAKELRKKELIDKIKLKEEAIKWIKKLKRIEHIVNTPSFTLNTSEIEMKLYNGSYKILEDGQEYEEWEEASDITGAIKVLMDFFNITEEDLK